MPTRMSGLDRIDAKFDEARLMRLIERAMARAVEFGAKRMEDMIETRGTGKDWTGRWDSMPNAYPGRTASRPGRVASGKMLKSADGKVIESTRKRIVARLGYLEGAEPYVVLQEHGFKHAISGGAVAAMHALRDADEETFEFLLKEVDAAVREFARN